MFLDAELHLAYKVGNVPFNMFPYPHFYLQDVFTAEFYRELQKQLPDPQAMVPIEKARGLKGYDERFVLDLAKKGIADLPEEKREFWAAVHDWLVVKSGFGTLVFEKFKPFIEQRFAGRTDLEFYSEALRVQDITNYKLGPHTDAARKVVSSSLCTSDTCTQHWRTRQPPGRATCRSRDVTAVPPRDAA